MNGSAWSVGFLAAAPRGGAAIEDGGAARPGQGMVIRGMDDVGMRIIVIVYIILIDLYIVVIGSHYCAFVTA